MQQRVGEEAVFNRDQHIKLVVAPGAIETDFTRGAFEHNPGLKDFLASQTALGRVGVADDIGGVYFREPQYFVRDGQA